MTLQELKDKLLKMVEMIDTDKVAENYHDQEDDVNHDLSSDEMTMLCNQLDTIIVNSMEIKHMIEMTKKSPSWVRSKISVCSSKMSSIRNYFVGKIVDS